jgi:hypothetical protein
MRACSMAFRRDGQYTYRAVLTRLFDDPDYQRLSPHARLVLLTARLCDKAGPAAIFRYYPIILAAETGLTLEQLEAALKELKAARYIVLDAAVLWIKNGLRFDPSINLANAKHYKAVTRWINDLPRTATVARFRKYYNLEGPPHSPSKGLARALTSPDPDPDPDPEPDPDPDPEPVARRDRERAEIRRSLSLSSPETAEHPSVRGAPRGDAEMAGPLAGDLEALMARIKARVDARRRDAP